MASQIALSAGVRANLLNLQSTAAAKLTTQARLSTGRKVASALDNPSSFFTSLALGNRSSSLTALLDGLSDGIQTLKAADAGIEAIATAVGTMQATLRQARQDKSFKSSSFELDPTTIGTTALKAIGFTGGAIGSGSVAASLNDQVSVLGGVFPSATLLAGSAGSLTLQASDLNGGTPVSVALVAGDTIASIVTKINAATGGRGIVASDNGTGRLRLVDDYANPITIGGTAATLTGLGLTAGTTSAITAGAVNTVDEMADRINANVGLSGKVRASNDNGKLRIENLSTLDLSLTGIGTATGKIDGTTGTRTIAGNDVRQGLVKEFNDLRDQLDRLADDASYNGVNLLRGDKLKLTFNETATSTLTIQAKAATGLNAATLGLAQATNAEFGSDDLIDARLAQVTNALAAIRSQSSAFGTKLALVQNRQDFTKALADVLQTGADALTLADANEEGANLLALNTRQQLQTTSLSFAAQADQAVLQFLR